MSNSYYEKGANHYDHHKELHIDNVNSDDVEKLISAFFKDDAEDAIIVEEETVADVESDDETSDRSERQREPLSASRQAILDQLLDWADKGDWVNAISAEQIKVMVKTVLGMGESVLSKKEAEQSEILWRLLENGRGDRTKIVWQNLVGYLDDRKLFRLKGSPALNKDFFGNSDGYTNIDKGRPNRGLMTADYECVIPLLDAYVPKMDKRR